MSPRPRRELSAIVAGCIDYGESDRVVRMLTREGRIAAFANSARKSSRRFGGALEPLGTINAELEERRSGMPTLVSATLTEARLALSTDFDRLAVASYFVELACSFAPEAAPSEELFSITTQVLDRLVQTPPTRLIKAAFEVSTIGLAGYRPELDRCTVCEREIIPRDDVFDAWIDFSESGILCSDHRAGQKVGPKTIEWLRAVLDQGAEFDETGGLPSEWAQVAAQKVAVAVARGIRNKLPAPLKSESLLSNVRLS